jgi:hypothetical protein
MPNIFKSIQQSVFKTAVRRQYKSSSQQCTHRDQIQPVTPRTHRGVKSVWPWVIPGCICACA